MDDNDSLDPPDWYEFGNRDLAAAKALLPDDKLMPVAGMLLQQALEKYLKGYLLSKGWQLRRTHDLGLLLKALIAFESDFSDFADACLKITDFYLENRYPLYVTSPVDRSELEGLFRQAEALIALIRNRITPPAESEG
jgi:HEPN domain-containing protein